MDLNHHLAFSQIDQQDMLGQINELPKQLAGAWAMGQKLPLPDWAGIQRVLITGMGGSAIGADLLAAYIEPVCQIPVVVQRDYLPPAWAHGPQTLVIGSSHSGNTEETLSAFTAALDQDCTCLAVSTGGRLAAVAHERGAALWTFEHKGQPRAAVGFSFGLLLSIFSRLGLIANQAAEVEAAVSAMQAQQRTLAADVPVSHNLAKRLAGQLVGRWVAVFGAGSLSPVARRWKGQVSELAKAWAQFEFLPEADHNSLAGSLFPEEAISRTMALFLRAPSDHPRNRLRSDLTRSALMLDGMNTDFVDAQGDSPLAHQWTLLHLGDYTAYYLAMIYETDPTPVAALEDFKQELSKI
jgi:glucose/mannose-6-phosphate isomerase